MIQLVFAVVAVVLAVVLIGGGLYLDIRYRRKRPAITTAEAFRFIPQHVTREAFLELIAQCRRVTTVEIEEAGTRGGRYNETWIPESDLYKVANELDGPRA